MNALPRFEGLRVIVAGDPIADRYLRAEPARLSREAPVMVLRHVSEELRAGGAANTARNLRALGCEVELIGAVGRDAPGRELVRALEDEGIDGSGVLLVEGRVTPTKTRVLAAEARRHPQQVLRIDREPTAELEQGVRARIAEGLAERAGAADAVLLSDYGYGALDVEVADVARAAAREGRIVTLDPRRRLELFTGLTAWTPNVGELAAFVRVDPQALDDAEALAAAALQARRRASCRHLVVTRGNLGAALFDDEAPDGVWLPVSGSGEVTDATGAGDTVAAVFTAALAAGVGAVEALVLANAAAGVVVLENGAVPCRPEALIAVLAHAPRPSVPAREELSTEARP